VPSSYLLSFPTRRSSDLVEALSIHVVEPPAGLVDHLGAARRAPGLDGVALVMIGVAEESDVALVVIPTGEGAGDLDDVLLLVIRSEEHTSELQSRFDLVC